MIEKVQQKNICFVTKIKVGNEKKISIKTQKLTRMNLFNPQ